VARTEFLLFSGVGVMDGILYAVGGHDGPVVRKSVEAFNPETKVWSPVADMTFCRRNAGKFFKKRSVMDLNMTVV